MMKYHPYRWSRRDFMKMMGLVSAGVLYSASGMSRSLNAFIGSYEDEYLAKVAATQYQGYGPAQVKERIAHLFDELGGISDVAGPGDKVAIKINLTGGSGWANHPNLQGIDIRECAWTHPDVLRAVTELLIDYGVNPSDIYFVEALWDYSCYLNYGYSDIQNDLGTQLVNLNEAAPYPGFANISTGDDPFYYSYFIMNQVLGEVDCYVSIPKMKHHYEAGTTQSMKNSVGTVPLEFYQMPSNQGIRSAIHQEGGPVGYHLPRSICDLNKARTVNLSVIDGIKNAVGGEGPWNPAFTPAEYNFLLAGKDPVATDSIATLIMGLNPEDEELELPTGWQCDNHLWLARQKGLGTNLLQEIELVGDGAEAVLGVDEGGDISRPYSGLRIYQNFPNPFSSYTSFKYFIQSSGEIELMILDTTGEIISTLYKGYIERGEHVAKWSANGLPSGVYYCRLAMQSRSVTRKLVKY